MVDKKTVEYVANLARVAISNEEKEFLLPQLSKILEYVEKLKELTVDDVTPMRAAFTESSIMRDDCVRESGCSGRILENAPSREGDYFKIPKVIE